MDPLIAQVISLPHRQDRRDLFAAMAEQQGLAYRFVDGLKAETTIAGCTQAHKACVQRAKDADEPLALIMEDDAFFVAPGAYRHFLRQLPTEDFDLYLGGIYGGSQPSGNRVRWFGGTHCYVITARYYDVLLSLPEVDHIDVELSRLPGDYFVCQPWACMQRSGFSDATGKNEVYGVWGTEKWYKG